MDQQGVDRQHDIVAGNSGPDGSLPPACPRFATRDEWEAWHGSLTWEQQPRSADLDPSEHEYSEADSAKARARDEQRRAQRWDPDPFSYAHDRRDGPWPLVDQLEAPTLSNTWRIDPACRYSPGGFGLRIRRVAYCDLIEGRLAPRAQRDPEVRLAWIRESIEQEEASLRTPLQRVLRERHGRLSRDEGGATVRAMASSHLLAGRRQLRALRVLAKAAHAELQRQRSQLSLF